MKIHLSRTKGYEAASLRKVWELLVLQEGLMKFYTVNRPIFFDKDEFEWDDLFTCLSECRILHQIPEEDV